MELPVINIGNSKGIKLSNTILEKYNISDTIELVFEKEYIILQPKKTHRKDWENAFKEMHENGDDKLLIADVFQDENLGE